MMKISGRKTGKLAFQINQNGHEYTLDAPKESGGDNSGPSPKGLLLSGLIGCTGIDVALILDKMRVTCEDIEITAETDLTEGEPSVFTDIVLTYAVQGNPEDAKKIKRAVSLSMDKYCGVSAMLEKHSRIIPKIILNGSPLEI